MCNYGTILMLCNIEGLWCRYIMQKEFINANVYTAFCHAPTIAALSDGSMVCCWFGGQKEGTSDTAIWCSRNDGLHWSLSEKIADGYEANWNPVLFSVDCKKMLLFYKQGQKISEWKTMLKSSCDGGKNWGIPIEVVPGDTSGGRGPVRTKPIRLFDGKIIAGGSIERGLWTAFADLSEDDCITWKKSHAIKIDVNYCKGKKTANSPIAVSQQSFYGRGIIQPALWESVPGKIHMLLRSSEGKIYRSDSDDGGKNWCAAYATRMPNNNSGLDIVKASFDGRLYLVCNPVSENWGVRTPLTLLTSSDNGYNWEKIMDIEDGNGEFSYPAIICREDELIITYSWQRRNIVCCRFSKNELI